MGVEVRSKLGNSVSRSLSGSSLIGDGMLVRLRSSTLAILGFVAAVGLGMVAVASKQGWPDVRTGALPQAPSAEFAHNDPIAAPAGTFGLPPLFEGIEASAPVRSDRRTAGSDAVPASNLTAARQVAAAPSEPTPAAPPATLEPVGRESAPTSQAPTPTQTTAGVGAATAGSSSPVTAGVDGPPGGSEEGQGNQDDPGSPSWGDNDNDRDHGWDDDRWDDDNDNGWSDDDGWNDDNDRDRRDYDFDRAGDSDDRGGWGRH